MVKLPARIIPLWKGNYSRTQIEKLAAELASHIPYIEIKAIEKPIFKDANSTVLKILNYIAVRCDPELTTSELENTLAENKNRFNGDIIFLPSNLKIYDHLSSFNPGGSYEKSIGLHLEEYNLCYFTLLHKHPTSLAKHEFGHAMGLNFCQGNPHPNKTCVMNRATLLRSKGEYCADCEAHIERQVRNH